MPQVRRWIGQTQRDLQPLPQSMFRIAASLRWQTGSSTLNSGSDGISMTAQNVRKCTISSSHSVKGNGTPIKRKKLSAATPQPKHLGIAATKREIHRRDAENAKSFRNRTKHQSRFPKNTSRSLRLCGEFPAPVVRCKEGGVRREKTFAKIQQTRH